jgi:hypothetical protein
MELSISPGSCVQGQYIDLQLVVMSLDEVWTSDNLEKIQNQNEQVKFQWILPLLHLIKRSPTFITIAFFKGVALMNSPGLC